ncbi:hypothetical protein DIPPA_64502, partial [Diplonema papillatum]
MRLAVLVAALAGVLGLAPPAVSAPGCGTCSGLAAADCQSKPACTWDTGLLTCSATYTVAGGTSEDQDYGDIAFWYSNVAATFADAGTICGSLCVDGRQGRLARAVSPIDALRLRNIRAPATAVWLDGTDKGHESVWQWSDGTTFYAARHGCLQTYCGWSPTQPDNLGGQHYMQMSTTGEWTDETGLVPANFFCEFPCTEDYECNANSVCKEGRCVHASNCKVTGQGACSPFTEATLCSATVDCSWNSTHCVLKYGVDTHGTMEAPLPDKEKILFWYSGSAVTATLMDSYAICASLCDADGRQGHLARLTTADEISRAATLHASFGGSAFFDASDIEQEGEWAWSNGQTFYSYNLQECFQESCPWGVGEPGNLGTGEHYADFRAENGGTWSAISGASAQTFLCDFPCTTDYDCSNPDGKMCPYKCTSLGRCELSDRCCSWWKNETACSTTREPAC